MEGAVVADSPWSKDGEKTESGDEAVSEPFLSATLNSNSSQKQKDWKNREDGRIRERGDAVESPETQPRKSASLMMKALCEAETGGEEEPCQSVVPDPGCGEIDREGVKDPRPGGKAGNPAADCVFCAEVERNAGESGEETIDREHCDGGLRRIDAEDAKDRREEIGKDGRNEGGGTGEWIERGTEAVAQCYRTGYPSHLPAEFRKVIRGIDGLAKDAGNEDQAHHQGGEDDERELGDPSLTERLCALAEKARQGAS